MSNLESHRSKYKNAALSAQELRRRRDEQGVQLRKQKREQALCKRRTMTYENTSDDLMTESDPTPNAIPSDPDHLSLLGEPPSTYPTDRPIITQGLIVALYQDDNIRLMVEAAQRIRKMLSCEPNPPINDVIANGLLPRLTKLLERDDCDILQLEVAWAITNIASGTSEQTQAVVDAGAVPIFIRLLSSPSTKVCEQAVWALGNIIGDGAQMRDEVLKHGILPPLLALVRPDLDVNFLRNVTWVIVNLCRSKDPPPSIEVTRQLIPALNYLITQQDLSILIDTSWALSYVTDTGPEQVQMIIDSGLVAKLVPLLSYPDFKIQTAAIRAVGTIVTGTDEQTQVALDMGALSHIKRLLTESKEKIAKEALWFLSNVAAGDVNQIQAIIDEGFIPLLVHHLEKGEFCVQREAAWTIYNMVISGKREQIDVLIQNNVIDPLCRLLSTDDTGILHLVLDAIMNILKAYETNFNPIAEKIELCGGLDRIEQLQQHVNEDIYKLAYSIIDGYFNDDIGEDKTLKPRMNDTEFEFASPNGSGDGATYSRFDL
ncbi:Importin subunit alpha-4, partial [Fragariocoptes setiger]